MPMDAHDIESMIQAAIHQIVYQSLKGQMGGVLHALALQTGVPGGPKG